MGNKLHVGNLDFHTTSEELAVLFAEAGEVRRADVITDRQTQRSKGFGFVEMATDAEAQRAISLLNGRLLNERTLMVNEARLRQDQPGAGNFSGGSKPKASPKLRDVRHKPRGGRKARNY